MALGAGVVCEIAAEIRLHNTHSDPTTTRLDVAVNTIRCFPPRERPREEQLRERLRGSCGQRPSCGVDAVSGPLLRKVATPTISRRLRLLLVREAAKETKMVVTLYHMRPFLTAGAVRPDSTGFRHSHHSGFLAG